MEDRDEIILNELRSGNMRAYEQLFNLHYKSLVAKALYMLDDQMESEDIVQVMFIDFWSKRHYLTITDSLRVYLHRAVKNRCLNRLEARAVQQKQTAGLTVFLNENPAEEPEDADPEDTDKVIGAIHSGLAALSTQQRNAFTLIHAENKKYKEAAVEMGISINSLKTHLKLALKSLREHLK